MGVFIGRLVPTGWANLGSSLTTCSAGIQGDLIWDTIHGF